MNGSTRSVVSLPGRWGTAAGTSRTRSCTARSSKPGRSPKKIEEIIEEHKEDGKNFRAGWLYLTLHSLIHLSHPKDWLLCSTCRGKGIIVDTGIKCQDCKGWCYHLNTKKELQGAKA